MAQQRRMVYAKLFGSQDLNTLSVQARYLYIGTITLADDEGRLNGDPRYLKGQVFCYDEDVSSENVADWLSSLSALGIVKVYQLDGSTYIQHPKWEEYQYIRKDRAAESKIPDPDSWQPNDNQVSTKRQPKRREEKGIEEKRIASISYLSDIPAEALKQLTETYEASVSQVKKKALDLVNYCSAKGKTYKNYHAFLENALSKDFGRRAKLQPKAEEVEKPLDAEALARVEAIKLEIKAAAKGMRIAETL